MSESFKDSSLFNVVRVYVFFVYNLLVGDLAPSFANLGLFPVFLGLNILRCVLYLEEFMTITG